MDKLTNSKNRQIDQQTNRQIYKRQIDKSTTRQHAQIDNYTHIPIDK